MQKSECMGEVRRHKTNSTHTYVASHLILNVQADEDCPEVVMGDLYACFTQLPEFSDFR